MASQSFNCWRQEKSEGFIENLHSNFTTSSESEDSDFD